MKPNEAPEKIYLQKYDTDTLLCLNRYNIHEEWTERPVCANSATGNDIEYIRTNAFIKKAKEAFCKAVCNGRPPRSTCTSLGTCKEYDNFVKYMKGE